MQYGWAQVFFRPESRANMHDDLMALFWTGASMFYTYIFSLCFHFTTHFKIDFHSQMIFAFLSSLFFSSSRSRFRTRCADHAPVPNLFNPNVISLHSKFRVRIYG